jgi:hypothetical protein
VTGLFRRVVGPVYGVRVDYVDSFVGRCTGLEFGLLAVVAVRGSEVPPTPQFEAVRDWVGLGLRELAGELGVAVETVRGVIADMQTYTGGRPDLIGIDYAGPDGRLERVYLGAEIAQRILPATPDWSHR